MDTNQFRLTETEKQKLSRLQPTRNAVDQTQSAIIAKFSPVMEQMQAEIERLKGLLGNRYYEPTYYMRIKRNEKEIGITGTDFAECESKRRKLYPDWTVCSAQSQ